MYSRKPNAEEIPASPASKTAIAVRGLGKCYRIYPRPQDRLKQALFRRRQYFTEFWALRDISLEVRRGETVGIMGRNGCGKSTLLQLISNTLTPTTGQVEIHGRVAALLELGAGFNPEFTGRDNIFTNAAVLGLSREETRRRYKDIVAFAELENFIDQPVKTYSSGMYVRLAFAVAISVDPDILVIDEALSVGDEAFQRKCFARIQSIQDRGGTILFVSHSAESVVNLCSRAVLLDRGEKLLEGSPRPVVNRYHKLLYAAPDKAEAIREEIRRTPHTEASDERQESLGRDRDASEFVASPRATTSPGVHAYFEPGLQSKSRVEYPVRGARIVDARITTPAGDPVNMLLPGEEYVVRYAIRFRETAYRVLCGSVIKSLQGIEISGLATVDQPMDCVAAGDEVDVAIRFRCMLRPGAYFVNTGAVGIVNGQEGFLHRVTDGLMFRVMETGCRSTTGMVDLFLGAELRRGKNEIKEAA